MSLLQTQPKQSKCVIGEDGLCLRIRSTVYDECLLDLIAKMQLDVDAADLRALAVLGYSKQTAAQADRSGLSERAKAFLTAIEAECDAARVVQKKGEAAKTAVVKMRLALCALLEPVYVIGSQNVGTMMNYLVNKVGASWYYYRKNQLKQYDLKITTLLK